MNNYKFKRELQTSTNYQKLQTMEEALENQDFISELPDPVLHHILSSLDMIFVVRTSILSKRWRHIWRSTHFLNFNEQLFNTTTQLITTEPTSENRHEEEIEMEEGEVVRNDPFILDSNSEDHFMDFVNRVLFLHCKSNINTFSISGIDPRLVPRLYAWLKYNPWLPVRRDAEAFENRRTLILPSCFFNSNTLTTLKLDMGSKKGRQIFKIPDLGSVDLPCLKTLYLGSVLLVDGDSIGGFFSKCLVLETLIISNCLLEERNNLSIYGLKLKNLELGISCVKNTCNGVNGQITVLAPNLESFQCRDHLFSEFYFDLENVSVLLHADLDACVLSRPECLCRVSPDYSPQREEEYIQNVLKCLRNVCNVESLSLYMDLVQDILEVHSGLEDILVVHSGLEDLLNPFCNLRVLKLKTTFSRNDILHILVLEMCPHVETLILERTTCLIDQPLTWNQAISLDHDIEPWEMKAPFHCLSYNLEFLEVRGAYLTVNEFKFLRFILKNAMVLAKLVVVTCESNLQWDSVDDTQTGLSGMSPGAQIPKFFKMLNSYEGCFQRFSEKLLALPKASPNVEISFFKAAKL